MKYLFILLLNGHKVTFEMKDNKVIMTMFARVLKQNICYIDTAYDYKHAKNILKKWWKFH